MMGGWSELPAPEPLLAATGVRKTFNSIRAVDGIDLTVGRGEILGLIGPNGSGKSTLLSCLAGEQKINDGRVEFEGHDVTNAGAMRIARRGIARTFQNVRVFSELTVEENVLLARNWATASPLAMIRPAERSVRSRAAELLELTEMTPLAKVLAGALSGGQKRLLEFVMALMPGPKLVMLDEAASGVNPTLIRKLREYVLQVRERDGIAFVIVEHNVDFVFSTVDRIVVMSAGKVLDEGDPVRVRKNQEVIDAYLGV
ncbi:ABC transporter ATP-binding protein [Kribbella lupini]|uniref:ABC transporter ATP-binding protein n=1 Tax=Kribbella lupini TaxID=291602 RepID=A0ABN2CK07_9ACTN